MPYAQVEGQSYRCLLRGWVHCCRSDNTTVVDVAEISSHAMERMLERKRTSKLLSAIKSELDLASLSEFLENWLPVRTI